MIQEFYDDIYSTLISHEVEYLASIAARIGSHYDVQERAKVIIHGLKGF